MRVPDLALIVAVARNGAIGRDNGLAWHISSDLKRFKALTMGKPMLMGRKTFASIGKPLPGRRSLVLTRDRNFTPEGVEVVHDLDSALRIADAPELMVIGGAEIFAMTLPLATRLHLTEVEAEPAGDVFMPPYERGAFRETFREAHPAGPRDDYPFTYIDLERAR